MDFRHLIVTCLFSMLRLSFETQKIKKNYAILIKEIIKKTSLIYNHKGNNKRNTFKSPVMFCHG